MAATLITLAQAKAHLRIDTAPDDPGDADIQLKLDQAESIIRTHLKSRNDPTWTPTTVPGAITAAILLMLARLYEQRGDHEDNDEKLWASIDRLLGLYRDPALA